MVGSGELMDKPIALVNASARATIAHASLLETLTTMSARVVADASLTIAVDGSKKDAAAIAADPTLSLLLKTSLAELARAVHSYRQLR